MQYLCKHEILSTLTQCMRFARRHFGSYDVIDFVAVLFGYAISGERTLEAFYPRDAQRDALPSELALGLPLTDGLSLSWNRAQETASNLTVRMKWLVNAIKGTLLACCHLVAHPVGRPLKLVRVSPQLPLQ